MKKLILFSFGGTLVLSDDDVLTFGARLIKKRITAIRTNDLSGAL
jgi:hypothetical protein